MFYYKCQWTAEKVKEEFKRALKEDKKKKKVFSTDGKKLVFIHRDELDELEMTPNSLKTPKGKKYKMVAASAASVQMLREYFAK